MSIKDLYEVREIPAYITYEWLIKKHYAKRKPPISFAFGLYELSKVLLVGVITYGMPPAPEITRFICGEKYSEYVIELNRLVINDNCPHNSASYLIAKSFNLLPKPKIIISYSDTSMGHHGYIYQASNFIYTGTTKPQYDRVLANNKNIHSRHTYDTYKNQEYELQQRAIKHRYIKFIGTKREINTFKSNFKLESKPYPKGDNKCYDASYQPPNQGLLI